MLFQPFGYRMLREGRKAEQPFVYHIMKASRKMVPVGAVHRNAGYAVAVMPARSLARAMIPAGRLQLFQFIEKFLLELPALKASTACVSFSFPSIIIRNTP